MNGMLLCAALFAAGVPRAEHGCKYTKDIVQQAKIHNIDPVLYASLIYVESRWKKNAHGSSGECGLAQAVPHYTKKPRRTCRQLKKPKIAIETGAKTLSYWVNVYGQGNYHIGLCGYNAGYRCKGRNKHKRGVKYRKHVYKWADKINLALETTHLTESGAPYSWQPDESR